MSTKKIGLDALLTPEESVLLLIDHQHGGGSAVAFAWEMQLLNSAVTTNVA
jgi:hypothetical protein